MGVDGLLTYNELIVKYRSFGTGSNITLAFHGFGRSPEDFSVFTPLLKPSDRLISIEVFGHSEESFPKNRIPEKPIQTVELKQLTEFIMAEFNVQKINLIGYSLGGKICLTILSMMPQQIDKILLFAPDGLKLNPLYNFMSNTVIGRQIARRLIERPNGFFTIANGLKKMGLLDAKIHRFVMSQLETKAKRQLVFDVWMIHRKLYPNLKKMKREIQIFETQATLFFGKYDRVIPSHLGEKAKIKNSSNPKIHILETGHLLLTPETTAYMLKNKIW